jgi:hypothetical protein
MRVHVYYNLQKRCLSIRHRGKVIKHAKSVILRDASFRVQPAGRERVLKQKRKNVHAYVAGELVEDFWFTEPSSRIFEGKRIVTYNPYKHKSFVDTNTGQPVTEAAHVLIRDKKITIGKYSP